MTQCRVTPYADPGEVYPRRRVGGFFVAGHGVDARTSASASVAAGTCSGARKVAMMARRSGFWATRSVRVAKTPRRSAYRLSRHQGRL